MLALPFLIWRGNPFPIWSGESYKEPIPSSKCKRFVFEPSMLQETVNLVKASHYGAQKNFSLHPQIVYSNCINTNQKYTLLRFFLRTLGVPYSLFVEGLFWPPSDSAIYWNKSYTVVESSELIWCIRIKLQMLLNEFLTFSGSEHLQTQWATVHPQLPENKCLCRHWSLLAALHLHDGGCHVGVLVLLWSAHKKDILRGSILWINFRYLSWGTLDGWNMLQIYKFDITYSIFLIFFHHQRESTWKLSGSREAKVAAAPHKTAPLKEQGICTHSHGDRTPF